MSRPVVLYVCHNHPSVRPGGAENYAHELFQAFDLSEEFDAVFLAKGGPPLGYSGRPHEGTVIAPVGRRSDDYFFFTDGYQFDWLLGTLTDKDFYTYHLRKFLLAINPDVIHFQHTLFLGYDVLREIRSTLPDAVIVYTLHEYAPICHRDGQLLRVRDNKPCHEPSPRHCHECFPEVSAQDFFLRERFIKSHLSVVDRFVAPSEFLRQRFIEWGIPADKIVFEPNGRAFDVSPASTTPRRHRDRFAFFGQLNPFKGVDVLIEAMRLVAGGNATHVRRRFAEPAEPGPATAEGPEASPHLWLNGANLELREAAYQERFHSLLAATAGSVTMAGRYEQSQLPRLMAGVDWVVVPSIWFENSPLVIQEAFFHGRPVICSDIGGMAEKVTDGVDGLHFRAGDPHHLAEVIRRAATEEGLWESLHAGIRPVHSLTEHVANLTHLYHDLLTSHRRLTHVH
jgi:glycosyltransferase involved in cell wall biosynthesis